MKNNAQDTPLFKNGIAMPSKPNYTQTINRILSSLGVEDLEFSLGSDLLITRQGHGFIASCLFFFVFESSNFSSNSYLV